MAMLKQGGWHDDGKGHRLLVRETADLRIAYAGPLQMGAGESPEEMKYFAAATGRSDHLPHELSIWRKAPSQKVLNVTWDDGGKIELIIYEHGEWEAVLVGEGEVKRALLDLGEPCRSGELAHSGAERDSELQFRHGVEKFRL
jgi:hypothetical protein